MKTARQSITKAERYAEIFEELQESCGRLGARATAGDSFEAIEDELHGKFMAAQRQLLGKYLSSYDIDAKHIATEKKTIQKQFEVKNDT